MKCPVLQIHGIILLIGFKDLPKLERVMIGNNAFATCSCIDVMNCEKLQVLSVGNESFTGKATTQASKLVHLPSLKWFTVGDNSMSGVEHILVEGSG